MPLPELLGYLGSLGDAPDVWSTERMITCKGSVYVRAREGQRWDGTTWHAHYIWVRW